MKKARAFTLLTLISILCIFVLFGCKNKEDNVSSISKTLILDSTEFRTICLLSNPATGKFESDKPLVSLKNALEPLLSLLLTPLVVLIVNDYFSMTNCMCSNAIFNAFATSESQPLDLLTRL